jgi:hypothetical protein
MYIGMYIYVCLCVSMYVYVFIFLCMYVYVYTRIYMYVCMQFSILFSKHFPLSDILALPNVFSDSLYPQVDI